MPCLLSGFSGRPERHLDEPDISTRLVRVPERPYNKPLPKAESSALGCGHGGDVCVNNRTIIVTMPIIAGTPTVSITPSI